MARKKPETVARALNELSIAVSRAWDIPFVLPRCPFCGGVIFQAQTGERHPLRHFDCLVCGWWLIIDAELIRGAILGSADPDGDDHAGGSNGEVWFNSETGKLILYPTDQERRDRKAAAAKAEQRQTDLLTFCA
ncbi:MAG: hypothetical protein PHS18_04175 [Sphaerochaetaceae bacterium]|nr:hypothetical protein [Sphaerochaetaceae bacterium]